MDTAIKMIVSFSIYFMGIIYFFLVRKDPTPEIEIKKPKNEAILAIVFWIFILILNNGLLYLGVSTDARRVTEILLPLLSLVIFREHIASLGFSWGNIKTNLILTAFIFIIIIVSILSPRFRLDNEVLQGGLHYIFLVGFPLELFYRGYLQTRLEKWLGNLKGLLITSAMFGMYHYLRQIAVNPTINFHQVIHTFLYAIIWGYIYQKSRSILLLILFHGIWDIVIFYFIRG